MSQFLLIERNILRATMVYHDSMDYDEYEELGCVTTFGPTKTAMAA